MKLRRPTDFLILDALEETGRNVAPNLVSYTGKSRKNINLRLPVLADYDLVHKIGPADYSGLYVNHSARESCIGPSRPVRRR